MELRNDARGRLSALSGLAYAVVAGVALSQSCSAEGSRDSASASAVATCSSEVLSTTPPSWGDLGWAVSDFGTFAEAPRVRTFPMVGGHAVLENQLRGAGTEGEARLVSVPDDVDPYFTAEKRVRSGTLPEELARTVGSRVFGWPPVGNRCDFLLGDIVARAWGGWPSPVWREASSAERARWVFRDGTHFLAAPVLGECARPAQRLYAMDEGALERVSEWSPDHDARLASAFGAMLDDIVRHEPEVAALQAEFQRAMGSQPADASSLWWQHSSAFRRIDVATSASGVHVFVVTLSTVALGEESLFEGSWLGVFSTDSGPEVRSLGPSRFPSLSRNELVDPTTRVRLFGTEGSLPVIQYADDALVPRDGRYAAEGPAVPADPLNSYFQPDGR